MFYCLRNSEKRSGQSRIEVFHFEELPKKKKKKKGNKKPIVFIIC